MGLSTKCTGASMSLKFFQQQHLMHVFARESVGSRDEDLIKMALAHLIAEAI